MAMRLLRRSGSSRAALPTVGLAKPTPLSDVSESPEIIEDLKNSCRLGRCVLSDAAAPYVIGYLDKIRVLHQKARRIFSVLPAFYGEHITALTFFSWILRKWERVHRIIAPSALLKDNTIYVQEDWLPGACTFRVRVAPGMPVLLNDRAIDPIGFRLTGIWENRKQNERYDMGCGHEATEAGACEQCYDMIWEVDT